MPKYADSPSAMAAEPIAVQVVPLPDQYAVTRVPARTARTHTGARTDVGPPVDALMLPSAARRWKAMPLPAETRAYPWAAFRFSDERIITPALDQECWKVRLSMRAVISASPEIRWYMKW